MSTSRFSNNAALNALATSGSAEVFGRKAEKTITFAAATTGAVDTHDLFEVTGTVAMTVIGICTTNVAGSGIIEVGTALNTDGLIVQTTGTDIDINNIWHDASPDSSIETVDILAKKIVNQDVSYKITSNTLTGGVVRFLCFWIPISAEGYVEAV